MQIKKVLSLMLSLVMLLGVLPVAAFADSSEPDLVDGVYQIGTEEQLRWFAAKVNSGEATISGALTADITVSSETWWPGIGSSGSTPFSGNFDGKGHTVTFEGSTWGLFVNVKGQKISTGNYEISNISNVNVSGFIKHAAIAHYASYATITGCINRASITNSGESYVGGIVCSSGCDQQGIDFYNSLVIDMCGNEASVTGSEYVGGIIGNFGIDYGGINVVVKNSYNSGNIYGNSHVGGIAGTAKNYEGSSYISDCYNTGRVSGNSYVGGILGYLDATMKVINCYNSGNTTYAIAGGVYDRRSTITNCYFLGTNSAKSTPDYTDTVYHDHNTNEIASRATAMSAAEMSSEEFAQLLSSSFKQSCPTAVLTWQASSDHSGDVCENCGLGGVEKEVYDVSFESSAAYTLVGESRVERGSAYTFSLNISDGYRADNLKVKVNGQLCNANTDGSYTVLNVSGPLSVTVSGVIVIPGSQAIKLPADGNGYRIAGANTVKDGENYEFEISFVDGFSAGDNFTVKAKEIRSDDKEPEVLTLNPVADNKYIISNVTKPYQIIISGVKVTPTVEPVTINFSVTEGYNEFHVAPGGATMMDVQLTVPYFDLSLYGLEKYYYNPNCYNQSVQTAGTPEVAYNNITLMHAYIVATEIYRLGYSQDLVGTGASYAADPSRFSSANPEALISWTQGPGSSFMDFWEHGTNMNYYQNYIYPLGAPEWGSTSDQILIADGDDITLHLITGVGSGSRFGFYTVNDEDGKFQQTDVRDEITVDQGQKVKLTLYWTNTTGNYSTKYDKMANKEVYWAPLGYNVPDVREWFRTQFGQMPENLNPDEEGEILPACAMVTDSNGQIVINTAGVEPGVYYIGSLGGFTEGGGVSSDGFTSAGAEAGPSYFKLIVREYNGKYGDMDGNTEITINDALIIQNYVAKLTDEINDTFADVDGNGEITINDALLVQQFVAKLIEKFPVEEMNS